MLYMAAAHGTMSIRVETNHARVKIDEKRDLSVMGGENIGRMTIRYVTLDKKWKRPTMEWKRFISVGNLYMALAHGTMSIRVQTNHDRIKIVGKRVL